MEVAGLRVVLVAGEAEDVPHMQRVADDCHGACRVEKVTVGHI